MGLLLRVHQCAVCNYYIESDLHYGNSGISATFLRHHYAIAICRHCHNIVSALVETAPGQMPTVITSARRTLLQMEADAIIGDIEARDLLPFFREALDTLDGPDSHSTEGLHTLHCDVCDSADLTLFDPLDPVALQANEIWIPCPRCVEGKLLLEPAGEWI